jgi:hypothetical protein
MIFSFIYALFYTLIFLIPSYLVKTLEGAEYIYFWAYIVLLIFSFTFKPNIMKMFFSWLLIEIIFNIDMYYHLYYVTYPQSISIIFDFSIYVMVISLFPISPLILAYFFYRKKARKNENNVSLDQDHA